MTAIRETQVKRETCCRVFYIVHCKFITVTNYYKVYRVFHLMVLQMTVGGSRDSGGGSHILGNGSVTLRGGSDV